MFAAAAIVASPPLLVPELGSVCSPDVRELRAATMDTGKQLAALSDRWIAIGTAESDADIAPAAGGTFAGFGADVPVWLSPVTGVSVSTSLPLAALIAGWLRGQTAPAHTVSMRLLAETTPPPQCAHTGHVLRAEADAATDRVGILIVADGSSRISTSSPGYLHPGAAALQQTLEQALSSGDTALLAGLSAADCAAAAITGRAAYQVLSGLFPATPRVTTGYAGAPFGVGYYAGIWLP